MRATNITYPAEKKGLYRLLTTQLQGLTDGVSDLTANLANVSAPCDSASMSEIVIPIHKDGEVIGVLDIDSPVIARFDEEDRTGLSGLVQTLELQLSKMMSITGV